MSGGRQSCPRTFSGQLCRIVMTESSPLLSSKRGSLRGVVLAGTASAAALLLAGSYIAPREYAPSELLARPSPGRALQILYGGKHWGGVGSEGYGTKDWDNTGWNAHYHPRDGASMDSESMEPYTWRKGPRVNDEYSFDDGGDPTVDPGKSWEPPIMVNGNPVFESPVEMLVLRK